MLSPSDTKRVAGGTKNALKAERYRLADTGASQAACVARSCRPDKYTITNQSRKFGKNGGTNRSAFLPFAV